MNKIIDLCKKHRETIVYLIVGVIVAAVNWGVYYLLATLKRVDVNVSNAISICCAFLLAFVLNKVVVFEKKEWKAKAVAKEFLAFFLSRLFTALIEWATVPIMIYFNVAYNIFGIEAGFAKFMGCVIGTVLNYFLSKYIVFRKKKVTGAAAVLIPLAVFLLLPLNSNASFVSETVHAEAPVIAETDAGGTPYRVRISEVDNKYYLFLPSNTDMTKVKLIYTGKRILYNPATKESVSYGKVIYIEMKRGENFIYEYDEVNEKYYKYPLYVYKAGNLSTIYIDFENGDDDMISINSNKNNEVTGKMFIVDVNNNVIYADNIDKATGHGTSSYTPSGEVDTKNSYNLRLTEACELIKGAGACKKWTLLTSRFDARAFDATGLANMLGYYTYDGLVKGENGYPNNSGEYVDVYINGEYRGVYILTHRMDNNSAFNVTKSEVKSNTGFEPYIISAEDHPEDELIQKGIQYYKYFVSTDAVKPIVEDITGGYVLELTQVASDKNAIFETKHGVYVKIKYPDSPTKEQVCYIASYVQEFEDALYSETGFNSIGKYYTDYVDINSVACQMLVYGFYENWEYCRTSTFFYKDVDVDDNPTKMVFGPVWDFETDNNYYYYNSIFTSVFYINDFQYAWVEQLWQKSEFMEYAVAENVELKKLLQVVLGKDNGNQIFVLEDWIQDISISMEMNWLRWDLDWTYLRLVEDMQDALEYRYNKWFDEFWNSNKYLIYADASYKKTSKGIKLTADTEGVNNNDFAWFKVDEEDMTKSSFVGTGKSITVSEEGKYYYTVSGPLNAYSSLCPGEVFGNKTYTVTSDICDTTKEEPAKATAIKGNSIWSIYNVNDNRFTFFYGESKNAFFRMLFVVLIVGTIIACIFSLKGNKKRYKR